MVEPRIDAPVEPRIHPVWSAQVAPFVLDGKPVPGAAAVRVSLGDQVVVLSGQCAFRDGVLVGEGDIEAQVAQTMDNVMSLLTAAGAGPHHIFKLMAWVTAREHISTYAAVRARYLDGHAPASTTVISELADPRMLVEVEAWALVPDDRPRGSSSDD